MADGPLEDLFASVVVQGSARFSQEEREFITAEA
jgi:hypothetical protein